MTTLHPTNRLDISAEDLALHCTAGSEFLDHARNTDASDEHCCMISTVLHQLKVELIRHRWEAGTTALVPLLEGVSTDIERICCITPDDDIWEVTPLGRMAYDSAGLVHPYLGLPDIED
jgi:hypothetical protein